MRIIPVNLHRISLFLHLLYAGMCVPSRGCLAGASMKTCYRSTVEGFRNYVILLVFLDTGMRLSELCGLRVSDVHERYVKVFGKGRKEREIGLHPEVGKLLWKYIYKYRQPADPDETALFIGRRGEPLRLNGVQAILER